MENARDYLYTWNPRSPEHIKKVRIEDETLRDGIQGAFVRRPTIEERLELLGWAAAVGVHQSMLGFPGSSQQEYADCRRLVQHIDQQGWGISPHFLGRPIEQDLAPIVEMNDAAKCSVWADFWINVNPLRMRIEGWDLAGMQARTTTAGAYLRQHGVQFSVSVEDATRTHRDTLGEMIRLCVGCGADMIAICDTSGDCRPEGAARVTEFVLKVVGETGANPQILWHGHNDRGLSLANAIAAAEAGVDIISGTFTGVGERAGNTPLEQVAIYLHQCGHTGFNLAAVASYCDAIAKHLRMAISDIHPLIGRQAFSTTAGTHAAAIIKAKTLGDDFADYVFSSVSASLIGRRQDILIGPTSGAASVRYKLMEIGVDASEKNTERVLAIAKKRGICLTTDEIKAIVSGTNENAF